MKEMRFDSKLNVSFSLFVNHFDHPSPCTFCSFPPLLPKRIVIFRTQIWVLSSCEEKGRCVRVICFLMGHNTQVMQYSDCSRVRKKERTRIQSSYSEWRKQDKMIHHLFLVFFSRWFLPFPSVSKLFGARNFTPRKIQCSILLQIVRERLKKSSRGIYRLYNLKFKLVIVVVGSNSVSLQRGLKIWMRLNEGMNERGSEKVTEKWIKGIEGNNKQETFPLNLICNYIRSECPQFLKKREHLVKTLLLMIKSFFWWSFFYSNFYLSLSLLSSDKDEPCSHLAFTLFTGASTNLKPPQQISSNDHLFLWAVDQC